jgi:hypothetical protein
MTPDPTPNIGGDCGQSADSADILRTRPTPETDALLLSKEGFGPTDYEWRQHDRRLERERDAARELLSAALVRGDEALEETHKARKDLAWSDIQDKRELVKQRDAARELARELRDAMKAITPYIGYPSTPTDVIYQFKNALTKAKEVLP